MNLLTALIIQSRGDDIVCDAGGPTENGKYSGWIQLYRNGEYDHDLVSTEPVYDSKQDAIFAMQELVKTVRAMDLKK